MALICAGAVLVLREYTAYMNKRLSECEGFLLFIRHIRIEIGCFLKTPSELSRGFYSEALEAVGFLPSLRVGESLASAYDGCRKGLSLGAAEADAAGELFASLGKGYLDENVKLMDSAEARFDKLYRELKEECPKKIKVAASLCASGVLGFIILVI